MDTLHGWKAKRAGGKITVTHNAGKLAGVDAIEPRNIDGVWCVIAIIEAIGELTPRKEFNLGVGSPSN